MAARMKARGTFSRKFWWARLARKRGSGALCSDVFSKGGDEG